MFVFFVQHFGWLVLNLIFNFTHEIFLMVRYPMKCEQEDAVETFLNISYILSGLGVALCVVAYFVLPKMLRAALSDDSAESSDNEGSEAED